MADLLDRFATGFASCCVLSYERPRFLRDCLGSLTDAGAAFELIIHDDGSRDPEVRRPLLGAVDDGATVILNALGHNQGQGTALNRMFAIAAGDPIIKLDQDLIFRPGWLADVTALLDANPQIGLLGLMHYHHDPVDSAKTLVHQWEGWSARTHILGSAFAVRRACFEQLGPFEEHSPAFAEDWVFQRAVTDSGEWVCALPDEDLVCNQGFGVGPSTVVVAEGEVASIHTEPRLLA
jgi:glycosyltransferase involved in cell wall biosynthesis